MEFRKRYEILIDLVAMFLVVSLVTWIIKYYFKPFLSMILVYLIAKPLYNIFVKIKLNQKISGALSILLINIVLLTFIIYLGSTIYGLINTIYVENFNLIEKILDYASNIINENGSALEQLSGFLNKDIIKNGAFATGEGILSYGIGNICAYFMIVDRDKFNELISRLIPKDIIIKYKSQKNNILSMAKIEAVLVIISTLEIIVGFLIFRVKEAVLLGIICGILDILPYVGTVIVFIPIIIYNIIVKDYLTAFGLILLYILVEVIRQILEAKFLSKSLNIHPIIVFLSVYIGIKLFGLLGVIIGPLYTILAKELIYNDEFNLQK
ncbi:MAG: AI-2E family transporter [Clostridiaceae bacterium]|nr:AI-2E family transporter [Clostridiaceae bacterium]